MSAHEKGDARANNRYMVTWYHIYMYMCKPQQYVYMFMYIPLYVPAWMKNYKPKWIQIGNVKIPITRCKQFNIHVWRFSALFESISVWCMCSHWPMLLLCIPQAITMQKTRSQKTPICRNWTHLYMYVQEHTRTLVHIAACIYVWEQDWVRVTECFGSSPEAQCAKGYVNGASMGSLCWVEITECH